MEKEKNQNQFSPFLCQLGYSIISLLVRWVMHVDQKDVSNSFIHASGRQIKSERGISTPFLTGWLNYAFSSLLFLINPIPRKWYLLLIHCSCHRNMISTCGIRLQHLSTEMFRLAVPKALYESGPNHQNGFDDLGHSDMEICARAGATQR